MDLCEKALFIELDKLMNKNHHNNFVVDIGSGNNSYFLKYLCRGILFDILLDKIMELPHNNLYEKINKKITPENVVSSLEEFNTPENFLALNLDIDSYDLFVLINLLKKYSPEIIISEINEKIPMPVDFSVTYDKNWKWKGDHFFGYSLNCLEPILKQFDYYVYKVVYNNVILTKSPNEKVNLVDHYQNGYKNSKDRKKIFYYNTDVEYWQSLNTSDAESEIKNYFKKYDNFVIGEECNNLIREYLDT